MKIVKWAMTYCDCWCINCDYSYYNCTCNVECPHCYYIGNEFELEPQVWKHKVQCEECGKKFIINLWIDHL